MVLSFLIVGYAIFAAVMVAIGQELGLPYPTSAYRAALFAHIAGGIVALATGPFQFSLRLRHRNAWLHRALGLAYLVGVAIGGVAALAAAGLSESSPIARTGFAGLGIAWLVTGWSAWRSALARRFQVHRAWVYRSFALTLAAVTLRIELPLLAIAFQGFEPAYTIVAWLCWVPNLLIAEWLIRTRRGLLDATPTPAVTS